MAVICFQPLDGWKNSKYEAEQRLKLALNIPMLSLSITYYKRFVSAKLIMQIADVHWNFNPAKNGSVSCLQCLACTVQIYSLVGTSETSFNISEHTCIYISIGDNSSIL